MTGEHCFLKPYGNQTFHQVQTRAARVCGSVYTKVVSFQPFSIGPLVNKLPMAQIKCVPLNTSLKC